MRIALLVESLDDEYEAGVLRGAYDRIRQTDSTLLAFAGGVLGAPEDERRARNVVFDLVRPGTVDGVVLLASAVGNALGPARLAHWLERFRPLPVCSIGVAVPGFPGLQVDGKSGMMEAVRHLTNEHGARRVAFVRGPRASPEAELRYEAVASALAEAGFHLDDRLVAEGDYTRASGARAIRSLLDERRVNVSSIDAVVAANDYMALGALDELMRRGVAVPESLALIGFDDVEAACEVFPPLTTVHQPIEELGAKGVESLLLSHWDGPGFDAPLPTRLIVRQSCGCPPPEQPLRSERRANGDLAPSLEVALIGMRQTLSIELLRTARGRLTGAGAGWEAHLVEALYSEARGTAPGALPRTIDQLARRVIRSNGDIGVLQDLITTLRANALPCVRGDLAARDRIEDALHTTRLLAGAHLTRRAVERASESVYRLHELARTAELQMLSGGDTLSRVAAAHLPSLGVEACLVAVFAEPGRTDAECRVVLGFDGPRVFQDYVRFPASSLVPDGSIDLRRHSAVVMPITFGAEALGFAVFAYGSSHGLAYEHLREVFSTVVKGGLLGRELRMLREAPSER